MRQLAAPSDVKVAVYAICKNESAFIEQWIANMWNGGQGANQVFILDTGSTDDTLEMFQSTLSKLNIPKEWLQLKQQVVTPWRFDVARNINLEQIPVDQFDVLYCIDLDELVIPDFWIDLRQVVFEHPDFSRIYYRYAWSRNEGTGEPDLVFWYDKIHGSRGGWRWQYPVHETLICSEEDRQGLNYVGTYRLDEDKIYLHHYPDQTKSRGSYLGLLELRAQESPEDLYGLFYLAREYSFKQDWEMELKTAMGLYARIKSLGADLVDDMKMLPSTCTLIGDAFLRLGLKEDALEYYEKCIQSDPTFRLGYIKKASLLGYMGQPQSCYVTLAQMDQNSIPVDDWREIPSSWKDWRKNQILAVAKCWEGRYDEAKSLFDSALVEITQSQEVSSASAEGFFADYNWLANLLGNSTID